ncbi:MAG: superoxide dismutase [Planctomycetota bacterium]|jgi:Fe-Mn family superoxide dismutase
MSFQQPELPYPLGALDPFLSESQMSYHYGKHHAAYFKNLNALLEGKVEGKPEAELPLRELVTRAEGGVFNNAAQAWNHSFFWDCMSPSAGGGQPADDLATAIRRDFGSFQAFKEAFSKAAATLFGSGWAWLAAGADGKLEILAMSNAGTPLKESKEPLLTIDVWEHAYYLDYRNERPRFVEGFWDVVNWEFVSKNLAAATG